MLSLWQCFSTSATSDTDTNVWPEFNQNCGKGRHFGTYSNRGEALITPEKFWWADNRGESEFRMHTTNWITKWACYGYGEESILLLYVYLYIIFFWNSNWSRLKLNTYMMKLRNLFSIITASADVIAYLYCFCFCFFLFVGSIIIYL